MRVALFAAISILVLAASWYSQYLFRKQTAPSLVAAENVAPARGVAMPPVVASRERLPAAAPAPAGFDELQAASRAPWVFRRGLNGFAARMSDGIFATGADSPEAAAGEFLAHYAPGVLGVSASAMGAFETRPEAEANQVLSSQFLSGLPVFGSRLNLIFNANQELVYVVADLYTGKDVPSASPVVSAASAAATARAATISFLGAAGAAVGAEYPASFFEERASLGYRLYGGGVSLVYRYQFSLAGVAGEDFEAMVDAQNGRELYVRSLASK